MEDHLEPKEELDETDEPVSSSPPDLPRMRGAGGRPRKWPRGMSKDDQRRARKSGLSPVEAAKMLADGHPLDDLVPPRGIDQRISPMREFKYEKSEVSLYLAKIVIGCEMDWDAAVLRLRPKLSQMHRIELAVEMENNEYVQAALSRILKSLGVDEEARERFVKEIWVWFYGEQPELKLQASRILAKIFFGDQPAAQAVPALKIEGFDDGIKNMLGGGAQAPPEPEEATIKTDADYLMPGRHE